VAGEFQSVIEQLEGEKAAIECALAALLGFIETQSPPSLSAPAAREGGMTPAERRRVFLAMKKLWAATKAAEAAPASPQKPARRNVRLTPEGRRRLADAMKRRWAVKRAAASVVKKAARKKAA
jgi:hypothetical protein